jgi:class 3 adenylate cyclase
MIKDKYNRVEKFLSNRKNMTTQAEIERAIAALRGNRPTLGETVVETGLQALQQKLQTLKRSKISAERKQVTVMFADISGFTALSEKLDPEEVRSIINACFERLGEVIKRYDGYIDKFIGDEIMALFGAPVTHENDPERALRAALEMMIALVEFNAEYAGQLPEPLALHFGINTGLVIAGGIGTHDRQDYSVMGDAVNLASRLEGLSEAGEILVGSGTYRFTAPLFEFEALEPVKVKGKEQPVKVYRLYKAKAVSTSQVRGIKGLHSPLVGRTAELDHLKQALTDLQKGHGSCITLIGEAGMGKTRLITELRAAYLDQQDEQRPNLIEAWRDRGDNGQIKWIKEYALSHAENARYLVACNLFHSLLNVDPQADLAEASQIWQAEINHLFPNRFLEIYPYLAHLLDLPVDETTADRVKYLGGEALNQHILRSARQYIAVKADQTPLILVWDDLHWADPSSLNLIQNIIPLTQEHPLMVCLLYRLRPQSRISTFHETIGQMMGQAQTVIELTPLPDEACREMVDNLLGRCNLTANARQAIVKKAEGVPFFVEEVIRSLIDSGVLSRGDKGQDWVVNADIENTTIPDTLQGVIMARIDCLDPELKRLLQVAAVIGRNFSYQLLAKVVESGDKQ